MCSQYGIPSITARVVPKWYMELYMEHAVAMASWWGLDHPVFDSREVWFCTEFFGFPCATFLPKHPIQEANHANKVSVMIHEFTHHVVMERYGPNVKPHGKEFWKIHRTIEALYGIFTIPFVHAVIPIPKFWWNITKSTGGEQP